MTSSEDINDTFAPPKDASDEESYDFKDEMLEAVAYTRAAGCYPNEVVPSAAAAVAANIFQLRLNLLILLLQLLLMWHQIFRDTGQEVEQEAGVMFIEEGVEE